MPGTIGRQGICRAVFAAALLCAWAAARAQVAVEQARTPAGQMAIERAQRAGLHAGLERAFKTPLEIVWLRTAAEADMWRDPTLAAAVEACVKPGAPRTGCAVVGRTAFRYVFGAGRPFASAPGEIARLVVSSLNMPEAPVAAGRLSLAGSGRLYLVTPETPADRRPTQGAVILAAGSTLQVSDALSPSILVELTAPEGEPVLLGNLAATDVGRILALLVKPVGASAVEASVDARGRVALRSAGAGQLATLLPADRPRGDAIAQLAVAPAAVAVAASEAPMLASLAPALSGPPVSAHAGASARLHGDARMELPPLAGVERYALRAGESAMLAALVPSHVAPVDPAARAGTAHSRRPIAQQMVHIAFIGIEALQRPRREEFAFADLAPSASVAAVAARPGSLPRAAPPEPASLALAGVDADPAPRTTAQVPAKPLAERAAEDAARLRAEVEAEVARERARLAQRAFQPRIIGAPPARRFVFGV